jgi:hypothetical protein
MIISRLKLILRKFDHVLLLGSLIFLVASPIWESVLHQGLLLSDIAIIMIIVSGVSVTYSHKTSRFNFKFYFGMLTILVSIIGLILDVNPMFSEIIQFFRLSFFLILTVMLFTLIIRAKKVDANVVINSISGYLLLGLSWAIVLWIWNHSNPESFNFTVDSANGLFNEIYYSFVTLTTLGYGDMLPITPAAKSFGILISITGAFYNTIVLGMIVGKYISNETLNNRTRE